MKGCLELDEIQFFIRIPKVIVQFFFQFLHSKVKKCRNKISQQFRTLLQSHYFVHQCFYVRVYALNKAMDKPSRFYSFQLCVRMSNTQN